MPFPPPPHKRGISAILARYHMKIRQNGCDTPICDTISKGYCPIWGAYLALGHWVQAVLEGMLPLCIEDMGDSVARRMCIVLIECFRRWDCTSCLRFSGLFFHAARCVSATPQQSAICAKFSVFHAVFCVNFGEIP